MRHVIAAIVVLLSSWCVPATAQNRPTDAQKKLNREAYQRMAEGDHAAAIDAYLESLEQGELNVTWLNLGRAYQKSGACRNAWNAYEQVPGAPRVERPSPEVVQETLDKFLSELADECPTQIVTRCLSVAEEPTPIMVTLDGERDVPCGNTLEVEPGTHVVTATGSVGRQRKSVLVEQGQTIEVEFRNVTARTEEPASSDDTSYDPQPARTAADEIDRLGREAPPVQMTIEWGAIALVGSGFVVAASGLLFDGFIPGWPGYANDFRVGIGDFIPVGFYAAGATMVVLGIIDLLDGPEARR